MSDTSRDEFQGAFHVSRETMEAFDTYVDLLRRWNARINLISRATESDIWRRHMLDSAQLWRLRPPEADTWADFGAGAGFPGLVIALLAKTETTAQKITLVESDQRKCAFLQTVIRTFDLPAAIHSQRILNTNPLNSDVVSARALAPLDQLLIFAEKHRKPGGICLFPKGRTVHNEMEAARANWDFSATMHPSLTDPAGCILEIGAFHRV